MLLNDHKVVSLALTVEVLRGYTCGIATSGPELTFIRAISCSLLVEHFLGGEVYSSSTILCNALWHVASALSEMSTVRGLIFRMHSLRTLGRFGQTARVSLLLVLKLETLKALLKIVRDFNSLFLGHLKLVCDGTLLQRKGVLVMAHLYADVDSKSDEKRKDDDKNQEDPVCHTKT